MKKQSKNKAIAIFEGQQIRRQWDEEKELWYFSVVDIVEVLAQNSRPRKYWDDLKRKLKDEGSQLSEKIGQLKLPARDGKFYLTDVADTETMLRLVQSIPSPNAEPFKLWLARVGYERLEETATTEISQKREPKNLDENKVVAREGGGIAGNARKQIEVKTGKGVITGRKARILLAKKGHKK